MNAYLDTADSPAGPISFAVDEEEALIRLRFAEGNYEQEIERELEDEGFTIARDRARTARVSEEILGYTSGERRSFDVTISLDGSDWQRAVWSALTRIPFGETRTYGEVAAMVGRPSAARAVGRANSTNRLPLVVPCHRVVGADGRLTGFAGGTHLKKRLLEHESSAASPEEA